MIPLTTTSQSLQFSAADVSSVGLYTTAVYFDHLQQATEASQRRATQFASTSTANATIALSAPAAAGIVRNLEQFTGHNATATTATVLLKIVDGSIERLQVKQELLPGESLVYEHGNGYQIV